MLTPTAIAMEKVRAAGIVTEDVVLLLVDTIMSVTIDMIQKGRRNTTKLIPPVFYRPPQSSSQ